jgi:hypothetical protein
MAMGAATPSILMSYHAPSDTFADLGTLDGTRMLSGLDMQEGADGSIWIGAYATPCELFRHFPIGGRMQGYGVVDPDDHYAYVNCGEDGTVACLVRMAQPHVVLVDPESGKMKPVGPVEDKNTGTGSISLYKGTDGLLYIESHKGHFRLEGMGCKPVESAPSPCLPPTTLPDGTKISVADIWGRQARIRLTRPDGKSTIIDTNYNASGSELYITRAGPDGKLYGSSALPLRFFSFDPVTGQGENHGQCNTACGQIYSLDWLESRLYFCSYTHAILSVYDPTKAITFPEGPHDESGQPTLQDDPGWPIRMVNDVNPRQLGRMDTTAYRPRDMVAGPGGKVWVTSVPDYGMWGGTLSWYDPKTDSFGGAHRTIYPDCSPYCITHLAEDDQLAIGFSIYGGSGTMPRAKKTGFALWEPQTDKPVWLGDFGLSIIGVMDIETAGEGLAYAIIHPCPADVLEAQLVLVDFRSRQIRSSARLDSVIGWPLEVSFQRDEQYLFGATREGIYRVPLGTTEIEVIWQDAKDGPTAPGALQEGRYYFNTQHRLRSVKV